MWLKVDRVEMYYLGCKFGLTLTGFLGFSSSPFPSVEAWVRDMDLVGKWQRCNFQWSSSNQSSRKLTSRVRGFTEIAASHHEVDFRATGKQADVVRQ